MRVFVPSSSLEAFGWPLRRYVSCTLRLIPEKWPYLERKIEYTHTKSRHFFFDMHKDRQSYSEDKQTKHIQTIFPIFKYILLNVKQQTSDLYFISTPTKAEREDRNKATTFSNLTYWLYIQPRTSISNGLIIIQSLSLFFRPVTPATMFNSVHV